MKKVRFFYLEMFADPKIEVAPPRPGLSITHVPKPPVHFYRYLYNTIEEGYNWHERKSLTDADLAAVIHDPLVEVYILHADGLPAGFVELDRRNKDEIEVAWVGIMPNFLGQGLGKYMVNWGIRRAWSYKPRRLWISTCEDDHPAALHLYKKLGFNVYKVEWKVNG